MTQSDFLKVHSHYNTVTDKSPYSQIRAGSKGCPFVRPQMQCMPREARELAWGVREPFWHFSAEAPRHHLQEPGVPAIDTLPHRF